MKKREEAILPERRVDLKGQEIIDATITSGNVSHIESRSQGQDSLFELT